MRPDQNSRLLALDWGTSSLRAYLLGPGGVVLQSRSEPWGIMFTPGGDFSATLASIVEAWQLPPSLPAIACGMVGSAQGWREVPYRLCPAGAAELAGGVVNVQRQDGGRLHIVPGLRLDTQPPDVMRGEETAIIGTIAETSDRADALFVLPGTHSKWVRVQDKRITAFETYMTGEMFAALRDHTILGRPARDAQAGMLAPAEDNAMPAAFTRGVTAIRDSGKTRLSALLFSVRTLVLMGQLSAQASLEYLSGLLIGEEISCAAVGGRLGPVLIGDPGLCNRYAHALGLFGIGCTAVSETAVVTGLWQIAGSLGLVEPVLEPSEGKHE